MIISEIELPIHTVSEANQRGQDWRPKAARVKSQRAAAMLVMRTVGPKLPACFRVTLTRVSPLPLDSDNLAGALKAVRDGVASSWGVDDGSSLIEWRYAWEKGPPRSVRAGKESYSVRMRVEDLRADARGEAVA